MTFLTNQPGAKTHLSVVCIKKQVEESLLEQPSPQHNLWCQTRSS